MYKVIRYILTSLAAANASVAAIHHVNHMETTSEELHDLIAPTAIGEPPTGMHMEQTLGLIRIGFLTGNAINLMQAWDLHPGALRLANSRSDHFENTRSPTGCMCLLLKRQLGRRQSCTRVDMDMKCPQGVW